MLNINISDNISESLRDKVIFITGATGFLGKPLIAKILAEASNIKKIYLLIRPKKQPDGSCFSAQQRLETELFSSNVFVKLRQLHGENFEKFMSQKVLGVSGDISEPNLGIEPEFYQRLTQEVQVVINSAAVVVFDERLDEALKMNTFAPLKLLKFAKACNNSLFLHVSTAYVSGICSGKVEEKISNHSPQNVDTLNIEEEYAEVLAMTKKVELESCQPKMLKRFRQEALRAFRMSYEKKGKPELEKLAQTAKERWIRQRLIDFGMKRAKKRGWNDSYTYTKALGERMIMKQRGDLPTVILRPSIIESSLFEPEPGWIDGFRMADPLIIGYGKGRINDFPANPEVIIDFIPVDFVVNAILASISKAQKEGGGKIYIYQVATGDKNPLTFKSLYDLTGEYFLQNPMLDKNGKNIALAKWTFPSKRRFELEYKLKYLFPLYLTARMIDLLPSSKWTNRYKRRIDLVKTALERLLYYAKIYSPYTFLNCCFDTSNTQKLYSELSTEEKRRFNFDISEVNWKRYIKEVHIPGLKRNILKLESPESPTETTESPNRYEHEPIAKIAKIETESISQVQVEAIEASEGEIKNLVQLLHKTARRLPDKVALQMKRNGQWIRYTYRQFYLTATLIGKGLKKSGLKKGDRVLLYSENQPEWGIAYFAAASIGAILVPIDRQTPIWEVWSLANFVKAEGILASEECVSKLLNSNDKKEEPQIFNINRLCSDAMLKLSDPNGGADNIEIENIDREIEEIGKISPGDSVSIIFITGTLVEPKGAVLTHKNFISNFLAVSKVLSSYENDQFLSILPLYHAFEFTCGFLMAIYGGATVAYVDTLKSKVLLDTMREAGVTCLIGMPRLFRLLYYNISRSLEREKVEASDLLAKARKARELFGGKIRIFVSGGAHLDHDIYEAFQKLGLPIHEGYGLTECAPVLTVTPLEKSKKGSAGPPLPSVELKIHNPDENGIGEIIVKGENVMSGYYNNPTATQKVLKNGWLHTGDLGYLDEDGYINITGRSKNIIVSGAGKNVYPEEVETIYKNHPNIAEICALGIRNQGSFSEETHAVVVPKRASAEAKNLDISELQASIKNHLQNISKEIPTYQRIQKLHIWDHELPKLPKLSKDENSQLDRRMIKEMLLERIKKDIPKSLSASDSDSSDSSSLLEKIDSDEVEAWRNWESEVISWLSQVSSIPKEQIDLNCDLDSDLKLDSLMKVELLLLLEERLGSSLPDSVVASINTVRDIVNFDKKNLTETSTSATSATFEADKSKATTNVSNDSFNFRATIAAKIFRAVMKMLYRIYFKLSCNGIENIRKNELFLIAANHSSHLDSGAIMTALGKKSERLSVLGARDYFFNTPLKSWFFSKFLNVIPFDRQHNFMQSVKLSQQAILKGRSLLIYPEGTRSISGQLQPFKVGLGLLAYETKVPIIPAYISGTYEALPKGKSFPKRKAIKVKFGKAIYPEAIAIKLSSGRKYEIYKTIVDEVRNSIIELESGNQKT